ncbi:hypothetical protein EDC02_1385 [Micromonospora sp. Llam0]|nr:hypothetical protein EDC02_1385 [Micromonospora sp. Llam0]
MSWSQPSEGQPASSGRRTVAESGHPAWCDRSRCTADPASQTDGYRPGVGGAHRSAPIRLDLTTAIALAPQVGEAYLTQAVAPWPCETYLHIRHGDSDIAMAVRDASPLLSALRLLTTEAEAESGWSW